jgi:hypothetical protein
MAPPSSSAQPCFRIPLHTPEADYRDGRLERLAEGASAGSNSIRAHTRPPTLINALIHETIPPVLSTIIHRRSG